MSWNGGKSQMAMLRAAIKRDNAAPPEGKGLSFNDIILRLNNFIAVKGVVRPYKLDLFEAMRKKISRFAEGAVIRDDFLIKTAWNYYVSIEEIVDDEIDGDISSFSVASLNFYHQNELAAADASRIIGNFYCYKRAIRDPSGSIVRFLIQFKKSNLSDQILYLSEIHINRSFKNLTNAPIRENWTGLIMVRKKGSMFCTSREDRLGTPRTSVFHSFNEDQCGNIALFFGDSIEIVENWGQIQTLSSRLVFYRASDGLSEQELEQECDVIPISSLILERPEVVSYIFGKEITENLEKVNSKGIAQ